MSKLSGEIGVLDKDPSKINVALVKAKFNYDITEEMETLAIKRLKVLSAISLFFSNIARHLSNALVSGAFWLQLTSMKSKKVKFTKYFIINYLFKIY